jgi:hypothetical protein
LHTCGHRTGRFFPDAVLPALTALAQVAVAFFRFGMGYEPRR